MEGRKEKERKEKKKGNYIPQPRILVMSQEKALWHRVDTLLGLESATENSPHKRPCTQLTLQQAALHSRYQLHSGVILL